MLRGLMDFKCFCDFPQKLRLANAVDTQVRFQIGIQFHQFRRITGLFDHIVQHKRFQFVPAEFLRGGRGR